MPDTHSTLPRAMAEARFAAALALHRQGRLTEARTGYLGVLVLLPGHSRAVHHLGIITLQCGQPAEAIEHFRAASTGADARPKPWPGSCNRRDAPLFDTRRYCRNLEAAYREIWQRHERGEKPATICIGGPGRVDPAPREPRA